MLSQILYDKTVDVGKTSIVSPDNYLTFLFPINFRILGSRNLFFWKNYMGTITTTQQDKHK